MAKAVLIKEAILSDYILYKFTSDIIASLMLKEDKKSTVEVSVKLVGESQD